jgi:multimeric flavodoxin WrbA
MNVLALSASPHANGNTNQLLDQVLDAAREAGATTELVHLNPLRIRGCQGDYACKNRGRCALQDDMQGIYDKLDAADAIVFGSPIYMWNVNAQMKTVLDRLFAYLNPDLSSRVKPGKRSALVICQGQPDAERFQGNLDSTREVIRFLGFGAPELLVGNGLLEPGSVASRPELLDRARDLGRRLAC